MPIFFEDMKKISYLLPLLCWTIQIPGQDLPFVQYPHQLWEETFASWIGPAEEETGVFYFRKEIRLESVPGEFLVHISGDNRYRLFVNGNKVCWGPALDDLYHWNYETVDLAPFLMPGNNVIAAQVWNPGSLSGFRQLSHRTAFILQGDKNLSRLLNTDCSWRMKKDPGYHFNPMDSETVGRGGYIAGATDSIVGDLHPWNWTRKGFDDSHWDQPEMIGKGNHSGLDTWHGTPWLLKERTIPPMEERAERIPVMVSCKGMDYPVDAYQGNLDLTLPANSKVEILLDNRVLTMGFPRINFEGGKGGKITIQYQEALYDAEDRKGNRNRLDGKLMKGYYDVILPDGGEREFEPLWIRVFRFVKLTLETDSDPLVIKDFFNFYTAYPFELSASFHSDNPALESIWEASWRTARLCALETYMDCPYYEQIQYIGDTRIQALISLYMTGDNRLVKNALNQFYNSMQPMGLTQSRYPSKERQIIPPFSLYFIGMVHDYHLLCDDPEFTRQFLPGIRFILEWFFARIADHGMLGPLPFWNHIDGGTRFSAGSPPGIANGGSAHMTLLLAWAIDRAIELFDYYDSDCNLERYRTLSASLKQRTFEMCYEPEQGLIAGTPRRDVFSQHTNIFAILNGMFGEEESRRVALRILEDESLIQATLYFRFYLFQALVEAGLGDRILEQMEPWTRFLNHGLSTFPEHGLESRSDCHAWSAHPMYDLLSLVCGIRPAEQGFKSVVIAPSLGDLTHISAAMPHPEGMIRVNYQVQEGDILKATISLPEGVFGSFIWKDQQKDLVSGIQEILIR